MVMKTKQSSSKMSASAVFFHKHWWKIGVIILIISSLTFLGYNKYLDQQNVNNMKQLLADFEQLKTDVEAETGEKLAIEATCESVGKFSESYACYLYLKNDGNKLLNYEQSIHNGSSLKIVLNKCRVVTGEGAKYLNFYNCTVSVRNSNIEAAEKIFYDYDTSPGSNI